MHRAAIALTAALLALLRERRRRLRLRLLLEGASHRIQPSVPALPAGWATPSIAICGAGISGLTLAGILSRRLGSRVAVTVLERASSDRDQGYGLDLDQHGQEALARAGVYHRFWHISRPFSDSMAFFPMRGSEPLFVVFRPTLLKVLLPKRYAAQPESNRAALRDILMDEISTHGNTRVLFKTAARGIRASKAGGAELLDGTGQSLGEYDLVVDAMGLHSTLRLHRLNDAAGGKQFSGVVRIHGVINDPDATCSEALLRKLRPYGSSLMVGRGYNFGLQRFGAGADDNRVAVQYPITHLDNEEELFRAIGISAPRSRAAGIMTDERLDKVKEFVLRDMGDQFDDAWRDAVRCLERVTVRADTTHGDSTLRDDVALPLVCIGDAQIHCGQGGGGNIAMLDAIELSKVIEAEGAFDATGRPNLAPLRAAEAAMFARKQPFHARRVAGMRAMRAWIKAQGRGEMSLADFGRGSGKMLALTRIFNLWFRWEQWWYGRVGSDASTPHIYTNVIEVLQRGEGA